MPRQAFKRGGFCKYNIPAKIDNYFGQNVILPFLIILGQKYALKVQKNKKKERNSENDDENVLKMKWITIKSTPRNLNKRI